MKGSHDPSRLRRRRNRWRVRRRICLGTCLTGKGAGLVYVPAAGRVVRIELRARDGNQAGLNQVQPGEKMAIPSRTAQGVRRRGYLIPRLRHLDHPVAAYRWRWDKLLGMAGQQRTGRASIMQPFPGVDEPGSSDRSCAGAVRYGTGSGPLSGTCELSTSSCGH